MIKKLVLLMFMIALITPISALTISGVIKVQEDVVPNEEYGFNTTLSRTGNENIIYIESVAVDGECSGWITLDKSPFTINEPVVKRITIKTPSDVSNGIYNCVIKFTASTTKDVAVELGLPIILNVTNGITSSTPTPTQVPTPIKTITTSSTPKISVTTSPTPKINVTSVEVPPTMDAIMFAELGVVALMSIIIISIIYKLKNKKEEEPESITLP